MGERDRFESQYVRLMLGPMLKYNRNADLKDRALAEMRSQRCPGGYGVEKYDIAWRVWKAAKADKGNGHG